MVVSESMSTSSQVAPPRERTAIVPPLRYSKQPLTRPAEEVGAVAERAYQQRAGRKILGLALMSGALVLLCIAGIVVGSRSISWETIWEAFTDFDPANSEHLLILQLRLPRVLLGVVVGLCLGVAGAVMQALSRNPLAEPGLLGVNAGAAAAIAAGIAFLGISNVLGYMWLGMVGAAIAGVFVYILGGVRKGTNPVKLVLSGAALSVVLLALTQLILLNSVEQVYDRYRNWIVGSLAGRGFEVLAATGALGLVGLLLAFSVARSLDSTALGEDTARALGANPTKTWAIAGVSIIVLAGAATAAAGPITFLGLAAPHVARLLAGVNHRWVLPYSAMIAAVLMVLADVLGRLIAPPAEVSVGIMVALIGGPFFVFLVRRKRLIQL